MGVTQRVNRGAAAEAQSLVWALKQQQRLLRPQYQQRLLVAGVGVIALRRPLKRVQCDTSRNASPSSSRHRNRVSACSHRSTTGSCIPRASHKANACYPAPVPAPAPTPILATGVGSQGAGASEHIPQAPPPRAYMRGAESPASGAQGALRCLAPSPRAHRSRAAVVLGRREGATRGSDEIRWRREQRTEEEGEGAEGQGSEGQEEERQEEEEKEAEGSSSKEGRSPEELKRRRREKGKKGSGNGQAGAVAERAQDTRTFSAVVHRGHRDSRTIIGSPHSQRQWRSAGPGAQRTCTARGAMIQ